MTSLKAFHVVFIVFSVLISFGFSVWSYLEFSLMHENYLMVYAILSAFGSVGLIVYGFWFMKKINTYGRRLES